MRLPATKRLAAGDGESEEESASPKKRSRVKPKKAVKQEEEDNAIEGATNGDTKEA